MSFFRLDKRVVECQGNAAVFLNGLTSNTLDKPINAFLNIHGRIIATVEQFAVNDNTVYLVVATKAIDLLMEHTARFAKLNKTNLTVSDLSVYMDLDNTMPLGAGDMAIVLPAGRMVITKRQLDNTVDENAFNLFRLKHQLPLHTLDFNSDEMILNVSDTDYVSYTKGCFLGQEPVAKVHHRSKPTWRLVVKDVEDCLPEEQAKLTSKTTDPQTGRTRGFVFVKNI